MPAIVGENAGDGKGFPRGEQVRRKRKTSAFAKSPAAEASAWIGMRRSAFAGTKRRVDLFWKILATLALVAANGFFVAVEFAAVSARLTRLESAAETGL